MVTRILFLEDITAVGAQILKSQLVFRLKAKGYKVVQKNFLSSTFDFVNLFGDTKPNSMIFYINYLGLLNDFFNQYKKNFDQKTIYLIEGSPFIYNLYKHTNKNHQIYNTYAHQMFEKNLQLFKDLVGYVKFNTLTEIVQDNLCELSKVQKSFYNLLLTKDSAKAEKISVIQNFKDDLDEAYMYFREHKVDCVKCSLNYNEDISNALLYIIKYFEF